MMLRVLAAGLLPGIAICSLLAAPVGPEPLPGKLVASKEDGWPQWRGPRRDGKSDEKGLLQEWPEGGPNLLWKTDGLGRGYSAPIVTGGTIYITGDVEDDLRVSALDLEGKPRWTAKNGDAWKKSYPGARASCVYDEGRLYHMNAHGRAACLDAKTGKELWSANVLKRFDAKNIPWGISECLLVDGPRLIVTPGGRTCAMAALDKETGRTVWVSEPIEPYNSGYTSPILFELDGRRHLVTCSFRHLFGVDAETGRGLWKRHRPSEYLALCSIPVLCDDGVFITTPGKNGGTLYRLRVEDGKPRVDTIWDTRLDTLHGSTVLVDGYLYGSGYMGFKGWAKIDVRTGKPQYTTRELKSGSVIYADGRLYCLSERGVMALVKPTPEGFDIVSRFPLIEERKKDVWTHPVICDGRLYLRYHDELFCYDIRSR